VTARSAETAQTSTDISFLLPGHCTAAIWRTLRNNCYEFENALRVGENWGVGLSPVIVWSPLVKAQTPFIRFLWICCVQQAVQQIHNKLNKWSFGFSNGRSMFSRISIPG